MSTLAALLDSVNQDLGQTGLLLMGIWILVMVSLPVVAKTGGLIGERRGIGAGVLAQVMVSLFLLAGHVSWPVAIAVLCLVVLAGWTVEFLGSRTGFPFGRYHYTPVLKPQIGGVPVLVPLAWFMMMPASWSVATGIADACGFGLSAWVLAPLSGLAFTAWDLFLDPQMVKWNFWEWNKKRGWFGIPLSNYQGWFVVSTVFSLVVFLALPGLAGAMQACRGLWLVYALTMVLETVAQLFFWKLRGPAIGGFLAMGLLALAAFRLP